MDADELIKRLAQRPGLFAEPDPFDPSPTDEAAGQIVVGMVRQNGKPFGLNIDELSEHTLITGRSGSGKTTLIYIILSQLLSRGIPFWAFDFKQDYRHLIRNGNVLVFDYSSFRFNPLRPPAGSDPKLWVQAFTNVFCQVYWLLSGSKGIIFHHADRLYKDYGVYDGKDNYPSMHDLFDSLHHHKLDRKYGREAGFFESALNRTMECLLSFDEMFDCSRGYDLSNLLEKSAVFELEGLLSENQAFLLSMLLRWVFQYRLTKGVRGGLRHVFLFDEAKSVYDQKREFTQELGISEIAQFTAKIREFGEGLIVSDQMPTELGKSIKANTFATICMSQSGGFNQTEMSALMGLDKEQAKVLKLLRSEKEEGVFEAVVKLNGRWLSPFIINVMPVSLVKDVSDPEVKGLMQPVLDELGADVVPRKPYGELLKERKKAEHDERVEKAREKEKVEGNILIRILTNIRDHPFIDQQERISMLGLKGSASTVNKYFKQLVAEGYVHKQGIGFGRGRGSKTFYEITDKGLSFAHMDNASIPGKGDFAHKFWQHTIRDFFAGLGYNAEIEKRFGIKNVDVGFDDSGVKTAVEIELTPSHLQENVQRDFEAGVGKIIIAVTSKRAIGAYRKKLEYYGEDIMERIEFRVLADFLE